LNGLSSVYQNASARADIKFRFQNFSESMSRIPYRGGIAGSVPKTYSNPHSEDPSVASACAATRALTLNKPYLWWSVITRFTA